ncbi:hypothetical protein PHDIMM138B_24040 [Phytobacter diazotrophicus]
MFAQQIEHGGFNGGNHVDGGAQVKSLQTPARGVAVSKGAAHLIEDIFVGAEGFADNQRRRVFQSLADFFAAGDFADAGVAGVVGDDNDVTGEERRMCTAQVHQHAVMPGDRDDLH